MDTAHAVTARFDTVSGLNDYLLQVSVEGSGLVTSTPSGIHCGIQCSATFRESTQVVLDATPSAGYQFQEWRGACTGTAPRCTLVLTHNLSVTAVFTEAPPLFSDHFDVHPVTSGGWIYGPRSAGGSAVGVSSSFVSASAFGSFTSGWGGVEIVHNLDQTIDVGGENFELAMYLRGICASSYNDHIVVELSLLDDLNSRLVTLFWGQSDCCFVGSYLGVYATYFDIGGAVVMRPDGVFAYHEGGDLGAPQGVLILRKSDGAYHLIYEGTELANLPAAGSGLASKIRLVFFTWYEGSPCSAEVDWVRLKRLP